MSYYDPTEEEARIRRDALAGFDEWNRRALLSVWSLLGRPDTYMDFGCGSGAMVKMARACGLDAIGVDVVAQPPDIIHDLRRPLELPRRVQLATCIEVAEHLNEDAAPILCQNISRHLIDNGGWLVFTAALPGQQGDNHVNLKSAYWWREKLTEVGLTWHETATLKLQLLWSVTTGSMHHLPANVQVFVKGEPSG